MNDKTLSIIVKAQDQASKVLAGVGTQIDELGAMALKYGKIAAVAFGAAAVAATGFAIKSAASFEQTRIGLQNMLGSADAARSVLAQVSKFAADTPFEFPELANSVKQLVAFGFNGQDAVKTMKQLGDVSAAVGTPIGDLSYLMGTLKTQGRAFTIDIRQFAQRGIPIYEYLAQVLHKNTSEINTMIEAGQIGFPEVQKAFEAMTGEGGKFHGAMAAQSKSLSGLFSTLKDNIGLAAREFVGINQAGDVTAGSLFDKLRIAAAGLNEELGKINWSVVAASAMAAFLGIATSVKSVYDQIAIYLAPKLEALWNTIGTQLIPILLQLWQNVILPMIPVLGTVLVMALGLVIDSLNIMIRAFTWLYTTITSGNPIMLGLIGLFGSLAAVMAFNAVFNALTVGFATLRLITIPSTMASISALRLLILSPMVMGSIAVAGAIADIMLVMKAINAVKDAINEMNAAARSAQGAKDAAAQTHATLLNLSKNGDAGQKARANKLLSQGYATGGYTGSGSANEVAGVVHKGEYVVPKSQVDQNTGLPKVGATNNFYGNIVLSTPESVDRFADRFEMPAYGVGV